MIAIPNRMEPHTIRRPWGVIGAISPSPTVVKVVRPKLWHARKEEIYHREITF